MVGGDQSKKVIKPTTKGAQILIQSPMLSETNYNIWVVKMKIIWRSLGVWSTIEAEDKDQGREQGGGRSNGDRTSIN